MVFRTTTDGGDEDVGRPTKANSASTSSSSQPLAIKDFAPTASPSTSPPVTPIRRRNRNHRMNRSVSFHHDSVTKPERQQTNNLERTATNDTWSSMDESDADTISSVSEDGRYRPQFLPGHLLNRLRHRQREEAESTEDDAATLEGLPVKPPIPTYRTTPLASGALAPFAIMLEVPGLTTRWYVRRVEGQTIYQDNPPLLQVGLALSIASAIVANIMLVLRFANLLKPRKATLSAVIGFLIHDAINTAALTAFGVIHAVDDGYGYSQAYWMTVAATAASVACTVTLAIDYIRTRDFGSSGSGLTNKQTQLVIVVMVLLVYLSIGSLIWSLMLSLVFETALYFTVTTTLAVGFGDFTPNTTAARIVLFFYAPIGITLFAVTIYIARGTLIESFENSYRKKRQAFHDRVKQRRKEMKELRVQKRQWRKMMKNAGQSNAVQSGRGIQRVKLPRHHQRPIANGHAETPLASKASRLATWLNIGLSNGFSSSSSKKEESEKTTHQNGTALGSFQFNAENGSPLEPTESQEDGADLSESPINDVETMEATLASQRREMERKWSETRQELIQREQAEFWSKLTVSLVLFLVFWLLGAMVFHFTEGWTYFEAFYFCFVLFTTIGYGDFTPKSDAGRSFFIIWSLMGVGVLTILISVFSDAWGSVITSRLDRTKDKLKERSRRLRAKLKRGSRRRSADASDDEDDQSIEEDQDANQEQGTMALSRIGSRIQGQDDTNTATGILIPSSGSADAAMATRFVQPALLDDEQPSTDPPPAWLSLSPHQLSDLPLQLAKSALALQEFASRHIQSRQQGLLVSLDDIPVLKQHLPKHVGGEISSETWADMPMENSNADQSSSIPHTTSSHLEAARQSLAKSTNAPAVQDCLALISYLSLEVQIKEVVRRAGEMRTCLVESQNRVGKAEQRVEELEMGRRCDSPLPQDEEDVEAEERGDK